MFDASFAQDVIDDLGDTHYIVTRRKTGILNHGKVIPGDATTLEILALVQPASGRDLQRLPEERRAEETRVLFTKTPLIVGGKGAQYEADRITLDDGKLWEIQTIEDWNGYTKAMLQVPS